MDTPAENQKGFDEASTLNYVNNLKDKARYNSIIDYDLF